MKPPLTTAQLAAKLGVSPAEVRRLAASRGVQPVIDTGRFKAWSHDAVALLARKPRGRPKGS